jgi:hypothetical protein
LYKASAGPYSHVYSHVYSTISIGVCSALFPRLQGLDGIRGLREHAAAAAAAAAAGVKHVALSPAGDRLVTCCSDARVRIWRRPPPPPAAAAAAAAASESDTEWVVAHTLVRREGGREKVAW